MSRQQELAVNKGYSAQIQANKRSNNELLDRQADQDTFKRSMVSSTKILSPMSDIDFGQQFYRKSNYNQIRTSEDDSDRIQIANQQPNRYEQQSFNFMQGLENLKQQPSNNITRKFMQNNQLVSMGGLTTTNRRTNVESLTTNQFMENLEQAREVINAGENQQDFINISSSDPKVINQTNTKDQFRKKIMSAELHKYQSKNRKVKMYSGNFLNLKTPNLVYHKSNSQRYKEDPASCNEFHPSDDLVHSKKDSFGPRKSSPVREKLSNNNLQIDKNNKQSSLQIKNGVKLKRLRNLEKYANNTIQNQKMDHHSSTHTAMSASKFVGTIQAAGMADFIESGSNYGRFNMGKDSTFKRYPKGNRPWRKAINSHEKKISEIIDDTSNLTKSFTALQSKANNQRVLLKNEEIIDNGLTKGAMIDHEHPFLQKIEETELIESDGGNMSSQTEESAPDESSGGEPAMQLSKSQEYLSGMTYLVQQCKLKRQRFTYLGKDAHSIDNYGGKAMAPKAFRSQIADVHDRHNQHDEVYSERTQSSVTIPNPVGRQFNFNTTNKTIKLAKSQCKLSRPTISALGTLPIQSYAISPRENISQNGSEQEIQSIHTNDEDDIYLENTVNKNQGLTQHNINIKEIKPSEETIFLSSQDKSSQNDGLQDENGLLRRRSQTKLSNKGLQTSMEFWTRNQKEAIQIVQTEDQNLNTILETVKDMTNLRMKQPKQRNLWPTTGTHTYETKSNIAQCEVIPNSLENDQSRYINKYNMTKESKQHQQCFNFFENFMKTTQIQCLKYNSSLDTVAGQKQSAFSAFISLSNDGKSLIITNKKKKNKVIQLDDTLSESVNTVDGEDEDNSKLDKSEAAVHNPDNLKPQYIFNEIEKQAQKDEKLQDMLNRQNDRKLVQSSASCDISEIESFIYGGYSSRFWMLRKHVNSLSKNELDELPFHSWNCITLQLGRRDVDLVIKKDSDMHIFVSFLVYSLCTLDGTRNSAKPLLNNLINSELELIKQRTNRTWIRQTHENKVIDVFKTKLFSQIAFKYKIMKIRAKISYIALRKGVTIQELFLQAIYKTYVHYVDHYKLDFRENYIQCDQLYHNVVSFEKNLKVIAQEQKDIDTGSNQLVLSSQSANSNHPLSIQDQNTEPILISEHQKIENFINFKYNLKKNCASILAGGLSNPYKNTTKSVQNIELYTKEQMRNRKKRNASNKKAQSRPSADQIKEILRKDKCMEIFKDVMVDQAESLFSNQNIATFVAMKFKRKINQIRYAQLNIFIQLRLIRGPRYIEALLARIRISKEIFLIDLQQGNQVIIPYDLSQNQYPLSYRYYDSILMLIQDNMSQDRRDFQKVKQKISNLFESKLSLKETFGIGTLLSKFKTKKSAIQLRDKSDKRDDIDYKKSKHTKQLQRSQYLLLDDDRHDNSDHELDQYNDERHTKTMQQILGVKIFKEENDHHQDIQVDDNQVHDHHDEKSGKKKNLIALKYVKSDDVVKKQQHATSIKFMFSNRLNTLKQKGHFIEQIGHINNWINRNINELYQKERIRRLQLNPKFYKGMTKEREDKEFQKYKRFLQECAEQLVLDHRTSIRNKKHYEFYNKLDKERVQFKRLTMLEDLIEQNILYFNAKAGDINSMQINSIKTILRQKNKARQKKLMSKSIARSQNCSRSFSQNPSKALNQTLSMTNHQIQSKAKLIN